MNEDHPWQGLSLNTSIPIQNVVESPRYPLPDLCLKKIKKRKRNSDLDSEQEPSMKKTKREISGWIDMNVVKDPDNRLRIKDWILSNRTNGSRPKAEDVPKNDNNEASVSVERPASHCLRNTKLEISLPKNCSESLAFKIMTKDNDNKVKLVKLRRKRNRWVFIPSYGRQDKDWDFFKKASQTTIYVIIVNSSMFQSYVRQLGSFFPIIKLPPGKNNIGFARHWIVKIAAYEGLKHIWMMDDNVYRIKEYRPDKDGLIKTEEIPRETCFERIENVFQIYKSKNIAAMGPRREPGPYLNSIKTEFSRKPPQSIIYLDPRKILKHIVNFDKDLPYFEDIMFAGECENAGLKICIWNRFVFCKKPYTGKCIP